MNQRVNDWIAWQRYKWRRSRWARGGVRVGLGVSVDASARFDKRSGGCIELADDCTVEAGTILAPCGGHVRLGERVFVGPGCVLYGHGGLSIGADTQIAAHCVLIPAGHTFDRTDVPIRCQRVVAQGVSIGTDCWLGAGVRVLDGVTIGDGCVVGAGAVVNRSLPPGSVAVGVPARVVGSRFERFKESA